MKPSSFATLSTFLRLQQFLKEAAIICLIKQFHGDESHLITANSTATQ
jgi:hypothetical protein